ncbi:MAG: anaerobic ribonucleoside-triphosphate reductase activating protein [Eubacteriales bacterium]
MDIKGLQKLTLLDYPGKVACTVFTGGCQFRCPFCHNAALVLRADSTPSISEDEFFSFLEKRKGILEGVCVTGGEPLLRPDLEDFLRRVKGYGLAVKLDTNGVRADKLRELAAAGLLDYVAMDIKNSPQKYPQTTGISAPDMAGVLESIRFLLEGQLPYEFRTTLVREYHTREDMVEIGKLIAGAKRYFLQDFSDTGELIAQGLHGFSPEETEGLLEAVLPYVPAAQIRGRSPHL